MKKQIITTILIASISIFGIFASSYTSPDVILTTTKDEVTYQFKIQEISEGSFIDYADDVSTSVELSSTQGSTNSFTIATTADGNMPYDIIFNISVETGAFLNAEDTSISSGWFPVISEESLDATIKNKNFKNETVSYESISEGSFTSSSSGIFSTMFTRGKHAENTEVARFKLDFVTDDNIVAGLYKSVTTVTIAAN